MEALGAVLRQMESRQGLENTPPSSGLTLSECYRLEQLKALPSTPSIQAGLQRAELLCSRIQEKGLLEEWEALKAARRQVERWEAMNALAMERDALQATRPEGCWCLGMGGHGRYSLALEDGPTIWAFTTYCVCPEAEATRQLAEATQAEINRLAYPSLVAEKLRRLELPPEYQGFTLDSYPVSDATRQAWRDLQGWARGGDYSVLLHGPKSIGKTGLCIGALRERVAREARGGLYLPVTTLLRRIRDGYRHKDEGGESEDLLQRATSVRYLLLDDLGKQKDSDWTDEILFELINERYTHRRLTLFTSNFDLDELADRMDGTKVDRIVHMCGWDHVHDMQGPNLRTGVSK